MEKQDNFDDSQVSIEQNLIRAIGQSPDIKTLFLNNDLHKPITIVKTPEEGEKCARYFLVPFVEYYIDQSPHTTIQCGNYEGVRTIQFFNYNYGHTFEHRDSNRHLVTLPNSEETIKDIFDTTKRGLEILLLFETLTVENKERIQKKYHTLFHIHDAMQNNEFPSFYIPPILESVKMALAGESSLI